MALRDELLAMRASNREELGRISTSLTLIGVMVAVVLAILPFVLWAELAVGDLDWVDGQFWWVFLAVVVAMGWALGAIPEMVQARFRKHVLWVRRELDNGLWFFIADNGSWDLLRERNARIALLRPLSAPRPRTIPEQVRVAATYHRSLVALSRGRDPGSGGLADLPACTLLMDRFDNTCCQENLTLACMTCGGLLPALLLWPLAVWPLIRYIEYKAAVDEISRYLLADGSAGEPDTAQAGENGNDDQATS